MEFPVLFIPGNWQYQTSIWNRIINIRASIPWKLFHNRDGVEINQNCQIFLRRSDDDTLYGWWWWSAKDVSLTISLVTWRKCRASTLCSAQSLWGTWRVNLTSTLFLSFLLGHNTSLFFIFGDVSLLDLPTNVVELEPETDWQQSNNVEGSLCNMISLCSPRTKWLNVTKPLSWNVTSLDDDDFYLHDDGGDDADLQYKERSTQIDEAKPLSPHTAMLPNSNWRLIWINQS